ncbi:hypothetical protein HNQ99_000504 [Rhizorhapis suberifaciens]|uniref:Uncharacterized protein n=1 Tax=Rhizorhapis suberifaciens TaxID=13656 RepID=A0A840HRP2_9SPHN|nr:hypothetical protein [Rhizorhapis suberifaciens]
MDECIWLPIVALNETETLHCIEEFDRSACLFTSQLALRTAIAPTGATETATFSRGWSSALFHRQWLALDLQVGGRNLAAPVNQSEFQGLTFRKARKPRLFDSADVNEYVLAAIVPDDEPKTFLAVEEFYDAFAFAHNLSWHSATATTSTASRPAETASIAAAETAPVAAEAAAITETATAKTATITAEASAITAAAALIRIPAVIFVAETVPLVLAATAAASSVKTHALLVTFASSKPKLGYV